jgi:membrane-bound serine protease (ClpP class)
LRNRRFGVVTGREQMVGGPAEVQDWHGSEGHVLAHGERWRAVATAALAPGDRVRIRAMDGLTLEVEPDTGAKNQGSIR